MSGTDDRDLREVAAALERSECGAARSIANIAHDIDEKFDANQNATASNRLADDIFEHLLDLLEECVRVDNAEELMSLLDEVPASSFTRERLRQKARATALDHWMTEIDRSTADSETLLRRSRLLLRAEHWDDALEDADQILASQPHDLEALNVAVVALLRLSRDGDALRRLNEIAAIRPDDAFMLRERSALYLRYHYVDLAWRDASRLVSSPDPGLRLLSAEVALARGDFDQAIALCQDTTLDAARLLILMRSHLGRGEYDAVVRAAEEFLEVSEGESTLALRHWQRLDALMLEAEARYALGDADGAMHEYFRVFALGGGGYAATRGYMVAAENRLHDAARAIEGGLPRDSRNEKAAPAPWLEENMEADFVGGVPIRIVIRGIDQLPYLERLPWTEVVQDLEVLEIGSDLPAAYHALLDQELPGLTRLTISSSVFDYTLVQRLVRAPFFARLQSLSLAQCNLDQPALELLVESVTPALRELRVPYADARPKLPVDSSVADAFVRANGLSGIELLDLTDDSLTSVEVMKIFGSRMPRLRNVVLTANDLQGLDVQAFLELPLVRQLETLVMGDTGIEKPLTWAALKMQGRLALRTLHVPADWSEEEKASLKSHVLVQI